MAYNGYAPTERGYLFQASVILQRWVFTRQSIRKGWEICHFGLQISYWYMLVIGIIGILQAVKRDACVFKLGV